MHYAHQLGVVHRDVKPSNLIVDRNGKVWVVDFGLAYVKDQTQLTQDGALIGTLRYMSPEQLGASGAVRDHRIDVYAVGATLYEMLTGTPVFGAQSHAELLHQVLNEEPKSPHTVKPAISVSLATVLLKALEKDPVDRYTSAADFAEDLQRCLDHLPIRAKRATTFDRVIKWCRRNSSLVAVGCAASVLIALLSLLGVIAVVRAGRDTEQALARATQENHDANLQTARLALERGRRQCENGEVAEGLHWLAYALHICPRDESEVESVIRTNFGAWQNGASSA